MTGAARVAALSCAGIALLGGCAPAATASLGASPAVSPSASRPANPTVMASPSPSSPTSTRTPPTAPIVTAGGLTEADLRTIYTQLTPPASGGGNCVTGTFTPSWVACPLTPRLIAALDAALAAQTGPGADPLCGCQAFDPQQTATYSLGMPTGGGTIHVTSFGAAQVAYGVIPSQGRFLVDDIIYCSPSAHSIYPGEPVTSC
jgi:hypothetical protein